MKSLMRISQEPKRFAVMDAPEPAVRPGMVKIKVAYAGICGSDLHIYLGMEPGLPLGINGHEFSGTVLELGAGVSGFTVGENVTVEHTHSTCEACEYCRTGRYQLCKNRHSIGFDQQGAFAQYIVVDPKYIHRLPANVSLMSGALTEPLACIVHATELISLKPAQKVLVIGPGPMGLLAGLVLKAYNCSVDMMGTDKDAQRLEKAAKAGINVLTQEEADNNTYRVIAECSGSGGGVNHAIRALEKGGTLLQVGITTKDVTLPYDQMVYKELKIQGTYCHTWKDWDQALRLQAQGLVDISPLITSVVTLDDWQNAFESLLNREGMKTLFKIND